jgi:sn-glycerol 3-phosphate transport system permease protein
VSDVLLSKSRARETGLAALMLAPSVLIFGIFVFYPLARTFWLGLHTTSFADFSGSGRQWVGPSQYWDALKGPEFRHSLRVTVEFVLLTVPAGLALGIALAVVAYKPLRGVRAFRTIFSSTVATSVAVASLMWLVLLDPSIGLLPRLLPFQVLQTPGILQNPTWALVGVSLSAIWQNLGFTFIIMSAGMQSIPEDLYESALMDGAGGWRRFTNVTLPMLSPTILFATVVLTIGAFQTYGQIDLLTGGGPQGRTQVLVYFIFGRNSPISQNEGLQAASSILLFLVIFVISLLQLRTLERRVHYAA